MVMAVNGALFAMALLFLALCYRVSWAISANPLELPPASLAALPRRRRVYYIGMAACIAAFVTMVTHLLARGVFEAGDWVSVWGTVAAGLFLIVAVVLHVDASR